MVRCIEIEKIKKLKEKMKTANLKTLGSGLAAVAILLVLASGARASIVAIGSPGVGNSLAQEFEENGVGPFDTITGVIQSGGPFDNVSESFTFPLPVGALTLSPGLSASGWSSTLSGDYLTATITGGPTTDLEFYGTFQGPASGTPLSLIFYVYDAGQLVDETLENWSGETWTSSTLPVPEPTTMIAGAFLLLPFGVSTLWILRKQNRAD